MVSVSERAVPGTVAAHRGWLIWDLRQLCGGILDKVSVIRDNLQSFNAAESILVDA